MSGANSIGDFRGCIAGSFIASVAARGIFLVRPGARGVGGHGSAGAVRAGVEANAGHLAQASRRTWYTHILFLSTHLAMCLTSQCMYRVRARSSPGPGAGAAREEAAECGDGALGGSAVSPDITRGRIDNSIDEDIFLAVTSCYSVCISFQTLHNQTILPFRRCIFTGYE